MEERYSNNLGALTAEEISSLQSKSVCVVGCGGIGGYAIELLARVGIGKLTVVDGDCFDISNLNRQLLSDESSIGLFKSQAAAKRVKCINSSLQIGIHSVYITSENAEGILRGHDLIIDALDSIASRRILENKCSSLGIPLIHGAISGWRAQIGVILPGTGFFDIIYPAHDDTPDTPSLSFTPALAASIQVSEAVKLLVGRTVTLKSKLLVVDLLTQEYNTIVF